MKYVRLHPAAYRKLKASAGISQERLDELLRKEEILDALEDAVEVAGVDIEIGKKDE